MADTPDDLEKLLTEVRKTIRDNRQFIETLIDDAIEVEAEDDPEAAADEEDFEEL
jgi:hypothetical protein